MRAATEAPSSSVGVARVVSPSTTRMGAKLISLPSSPCSSSTATRAPSSTRCCLPPVAITAYTRGRGYRTRCGGGQPGSLALPQQLLVEDVAEALAHGAGAAQRLHQAFRHALPRHLDE